MSHPPVTPEERFAAVVAALLTEPGVTPPQAGSSFGSNGMKVSGKLFAMLTSGKLVLKLPRARVDALIAAGEGTHFDPRKNGRVMKEWISLESASDEDWLRLAREALAFVAPER